MTPLVSSPKPAFIFTAQIAGLTTLLLIVLLADLRHGAQSARTLAEATARTSAIETLLYRELLVETGGAYLPVTTNNSRISPDPSLALRADRDLLAPDGRRYTLITPPRLLALIHDGSSGKNSITSSIKTIYPLGQADTPDEWETQALTTLRNGHAEVSTLVSQEGKAYLRFMYPVPATQGCVANRPGKGLKIGDLLGGISLRLPMDIFDEVRQEHNRIAFLVHGVLWLLGMTGILWSFRKVQQRDAVVLSAEKSAREALTELEKTFDAFGEVITVQDPEMHITRINRAGCAVLGVREEEVIGKHCYEIFRGAATPCPDCPELDALRDGQVHHSEIEHPNMGKIFFVAAAPVLDQSGNLSKIVHLARDVTEQKRVEQQLRQAQKMEAIGTLAGGIAHDFNNILTAIIGFSELAIMEVPSGSQARSDLNRVLQGGLRAKELVKQILTFSRRAEQDVQPLRLQPIIKESLKLLRASLPTMIELRQRIVAECGMVLADPTQIHQVVMNLCTNAYQAMRDKGGILGVTLETVQMDATDVANKIALKPGSYIRLSISDTGSGITPGILDRIFEPYFTTKQQGDGTGLGLSVVHGIVQGLGGHITVYSEPGMGTTFHVYLPMLPSSTEVLPVGAIIEAQLPTGTERVLVLDDEEGVVAMEQRILTGLGYAVRGFTSCTEAMDEFLRHADSYDLIITDMNMPKVSGAELVETVRTVRPGIPVIMCTGFSEIMNEEKARQLGINRLLMKPLTVQELAQVVRQVLDATRCDLPWAPPVNRDRPQSNV